MSKSKFRDAIRRRTSSAAEAAQREDPMKSFDPDADRAQPAAEESSGAAPAERPATGNGSARTARDAGGAPAPEPQAPAAEPAEAPGEASELEQARAEAAGNYDRLVRLQAEFENYKKRIAKEHADSLRYALTPLVTEVAAVLDNLERALEHARKEQGEAVSALAAGIELVLKHLHEVLGRFGVTRIEAIGQPFDPSRHEAIQVVETDQVPENHVLEEYQPGYLLHDRVIRPARVSVAKRASEAGAQGPPAAPQSAAGEADEQS
jgi:molecular chaperone GrpE